MTQDDDSKAANLQLNFLLDSDIWANNLGFFGKAQTLLQLRQIRCPVT
jgi:hypothetical protein